LNVPASVETKHLFTGGMSFDSPSPWGRWNCQPNNEWGTMLILQLV